LPTAAPAIRSLCENSRPAASRRAGVTSLQVVERSALVTFTPAQMFAVVNDVARYPEFLPWCVGARVEESSETLTIAAVKIVRGVLRTEFTTRNILERDAQILMQLVDGPFRHFQGQWRFEAIGNRGAHVHFRVEFEFKNRFTAAAFNRVFETVCGSIVDAFVHRAKQIYGSG
jgi:ribosome-associated toxin RatA of RatAB toxin-antitoxin module